MGAHIGRRLRAPIELMGHDFRGFGATLRIAPYNHEGIWLKLPDGTTVPLTDGVLGVSRLRFLTMTWKQAGREYVLRVPEHLFGALYALHLDRIILEPEEFRLPHDGSAANFWRAVQESLSEDEVMPLVTLQEQVAFYSKQRRCLRLEPDDGTREFHFKISVHYRSLGNYVLKGRLNTSVWDELLAARAFWRSRWRIAAAAHLHKLLGWPHDENMCVWVTPKDDYVLRQQALRELCFHRLLDFLGALMTVVPPGHRFAGTLISEPGMGHSADLELLKKLQEVGWVPP